MLRSRFFILLVFLGSIVQASPTMMPLIGVMANIPDPCLAASPAIGTVCNSGAIWLGEFPASITHAGNWGPDGKKKYMLMPSGCDGTTDKPSCSGNDGIAIKRSWNDGTGNWGYSGVESFTSESQKSTVLGDTNTDTLKNAKVPTSNGDYEAAKYCADMDFGGYTDWYLPSKSELAYIYCKAQPAGTHDPSYPQEEANCGGDYGGKESILTGFANAYYWSSTEYRYDSSWAQRFRNGQQNSYSNNTDYSVRCVRRF